MYGAAGEAGGIYLDLDLTGRAVLVFGAEGKGLRPLVARTCDVLAAIPLEAPVESLNVSVAAALFLFEARRAARRARRPARRPRRRMTGTLYIVDGYNVLHASSAAPARTRSSRAATGWPTSWRSFAAMRGARAVLVFDGHGPESTSSEPFKGGAAGSGASPAAGSPPTR